MTKIIEILAQKINANSQKIDDFFLQKFQKNPPLFYNSVDLRHNQIKIAPVDTNCFPAGFNNLSKISKDRAQIMADDFLVKNFSDAKKILIIPENHTRNFRYLENVHNLQEILTQKREVKIGSLITEITRKTSIDLENKDSIELNPLVKNGEKILTIDGFEPDLIILNNDLTEGVPQILQNTKTPITPSTNFGWYRRKKSQHFTIYNQLALELAQILEIDAWLISSMHDSVENINFKNPQSLEQLANSVENLLQKLRQKYQEHNISDEPYCYIKAESGTYGIAVWPVFSGEEVLQINKKERNKMAVIKGAVQNTCVIIQEGITTFDAIDGKIAEPMIYLINAQVAANLFRANENRDRKISLNAAGASFFDLENLSENQLNLGGNKNEVIAVYSIIARLAALASSLEN
jgi:glutamate--cysteine ligase